MSFRRSVVGVASTTRAVAGASTRSRSGRRARWCPPAWCPAGRATKADTRHALKAANAWVRPKSALFAVPEAPLFASEASDMSPQRLSDTFLRGPVVTRKHLEGAIEMLNAVSMENLEKMPSEGRAARRARFDLSRGASQACGLPRPRRPRSGDAQVAFHIANLPIWKTKDKILEGPS